MKNRPFVKTSRRLSAAAVCAVILCTAFSSCRRGEPSVPASATTDTDALSVNFTVITEETEPPQTEESTAPPSESETEPATEPITEPATQEITETLPPIQIGDVSGIPAAAEHTKKLDELLSRPPVEDAFIAFYYEDMATGATYAFNADAVTYSASLMKLPYALALLYEDEERDMGFDATYTFTGEEDKTGSGEIRNMEPGVTFTYLELIDYSIRHSDNMAFRQLREVYGRDFHFDYIHSVGADTFTQNGGWALNARDGAKVLRSAYNYIEGNYKHSPEIKDAMMNSAHSVMLRPGVSWKPMARKYGWDVGAYHDMGVVYDAHPYILVFLSDMDMGGGEIDGYIHSVAAAADALHAALYAE